MVLKDCFVIITTEQDVSSKLNNIRDIIMRNNKSFQFFSISNISHCINKGHQYDFCILYRGEYNKVPDEEIENVCRDIAKNIFDDVSLTDIDVSMDYKDAETIYCYISKLVN